MKREMTVGELLGDLGPQDADGSGKMAPLTFWVPISVKEDYDRAQRATRRRLSKNLRAALSTLIRAAAEKVG